MSMLELITKAASGTSDQLTSDSLYPIVLNPDPILLNLKPQSLQESNDEAFVKRVEGWEISQTDRQVLELGQKFYNQLKTNLENPNPNSFGEVEFTNLLESYLRKSSNKLEISIGLKPKEEGYTKLLVQTVGFLMGDAVLGLVLEACFAFEKWEILETLIVCGRVSGLCSGAYLIRNLVEKKRADLVCLCVKHVSNLQVSEVLSVLKFLLSPTKDAYGTMDVIRKEWESQTVRAIEVATGKSVGGKKSKSNSNSAEEAAVLLMMAHDEFTTSELCLHYLLASQNFDDVMFSTCIGKLNGSEIMGFVRYLKKWLIKYQKFPQACSSLKSSSKHGLKALESVPSLEHVTKCFGLVIDEHFSSLVMHPEFREEVKLVEVVVNSLASEARLCCSLASLCAGLKK